MVTTTHHNQQEGEFKVINATPFCKNLVSIIVEFVKTSLAEAEIVPLQHKMMSQTDALSR